VAPERHQFFNFVKGSFQAMWNAPITVASQEMNRSWS